MTLFSDPAVGINDSMLRRAYVLAECGRGTTSPNPMVGCVVVRDDAVVGEGFHVRAGGPHAEVAALDAAGGKARGAHVFVTLEPCNHVGRTPPCVNRLLSEGVATVTIGMRDPNPEVSGGGAAALSAAGVDVRWADDPRPFEAQNEAWLTRLRLGRPFVRVKVALTLDGRPTLVAGRRSRITGAGARSLTMRLRSEATAVAVGATTLAVDDPELTVRTGGRLMAERQPMRIVLSRTTVPDADAKAFADGAGCVLAVSDDVAESSILPVMVTGARVIRYPYASGLAGAFSAIAETGVNDVLIEAGPRLLTALWHGRLIDELIVVTAGGMGGSSAPPLYLGEADSDGTDVAPEFYPVETGILEGDAVSVWRPRD